MMFVETALRGAFVVEPERREDERGFFARTFCREKFEARGLNSRIAQCNISFNKARGALRGMHYQRAPHEEAKVISCARGAIFDAIIDLRRGSSTFGRWFAIELTAENYKMLYVPEGFAHGFQALQEDSVVHYQMSEFYHPECAEGIKWDDPFFKIAWPLQPTTISLQDRSYAPFNAEAHLRRS